MEDRDVLSDCSFYSDASNMDSTDEVCNHKILRDKKKKEKAQGKGKKKPNDRANIIEQPAEKDTVPENEKLEDDKSCSEDEGGMSVMPLLTMHPVMKRGWHAIQLMKRKSHFQSSIP